MKVPQFAKKTAKFFFDVPSWMGIRSVKENGQFVLSQFKNVLVRPDMLAKPNAEELKTFNAAMQELGLTDADIERRKKHCFQLTYVYLVIVLGILAYSGYLFWERHLEAGLISLGLVLVPVAYLFRTHFIYVQLKFKKLGLTFQEWLGYLKTGGV